MPTSIVQFENVRKHYQMGLVTVEALRGVNCSLGGASADTLTRWQINLRGDLWR